MKKKKEKRVREVYEPKKGLTGQGDDYHIYTMNGKEKVTAFLLGMAGTFVAVHLFFKSRLLGLAAGIAVGILIPKYSASHLGEKRKNTDTAKWLDIFCVGRLCGTGTGAWKMQQNL